MSQGTALFYLSAQGVEIVRRCGWENDLHVWHAVGDVAFVEPIAITQLHKCTTARVSFGGDLSEVGG